MKIITRQIASCLLALLVLFSTLSFTVGMHYCGDTLVDYSLFSEVDSCGMETMQISDGAECAIVGDDCCKDESIIVEGQQDLKISFDNLTLKQVFIIAYTYIFFNLSETYLEHIVPFRDYEPPLLVRDIHILDETFLI